MNDYEFTETLSALQTAIQMEIDGKEFYLKASAQSTNDLGTKLLASLAKEEDYHRQKFEDIFSQIQAKKSWPKSDFTADGGKSLRTIFAGALGDPASTTASASEIDAVKTAIDMEAKKTSTTTGKMALRRNTTPKKSFTKHWPGRKESIS